MQHPCTTHTRARARSPRTPRVKWPSGTVAGVGTRRPPTPEIPPTEDRRVAPFGGGGATQESVLAKIKVWPHGLRGRGRATV